MRMKSPQTLIREMSELRHKISHWESKTAQFTDYTTWRKQLGRSESQLYLWVGGGMLVLSAFGFFLGKLL